MPVTEEQYVDIQDTIKSLDVYELRDHAQAASLPNLHHTLDKLHDKAKEALDGEYDEEDTQAALEDLYEAVDGLQTLVVDASEALDKLSEFLSKVDKKLLKTVYADEID